MSDQKINSFILSINLIDDTGTRSTEEMTDAVLDKINEIPNITLQSANANLLIQVPDQQVNRFFSQVVTEEENGKKVLKIKEPPTLEDVTVGDKPKDDKPKDE